MRSVSNLFCVGLLALASSSTVVAQSKKGAPQSPVETTEEIAGGYYVANLKMKVCRVTYETGGMQIERGAATPEGVYKEYLGCTSEASRLAKETYTKLLPRLKKPDARAALKDLQVAYMLALESSEPRDGELKVHYRQRLATLDEKVEAAMQRLKLEL